MPGRRRRPVVLDVVRHRAGLGLRVRRGAHASARTTGRRCPTSTATPATDTGQSCPAGWRTLHPQLDHYQTLNADGTCSPTGTTGAWNAATGDSGGWEQWDVDLSAYAGKQVEVSITYASDWSTQGLGVFIDDIASSTGEGTTSFETGLDGWVVGGPAGSAPNPNEFVVTAAGGFPEGAVVDDGDTVYMGFGLEGITDADTRNTIMGGAMSYLLR